MRKIDLIVLHCSASDNSKHDNLKVIRDWHVFDRGFSDVGYHFIITKDGKVHTGRPIERAGAHCKGYNRNSIGICLTGLNKFSQAQFDACRELVNELILEFGLTVIDVLPHNQFNKNKTCPNFNIWEKVLSQ